MPFLPDVATNAESRRNTRRSAQRRESIRLHLTRIGNLRGLFARSGAYSVDTNHETPSRSNSEDDIGSHPSTPSKGSDKLCPLPQLSPQEEKTSCIEILHSPQRRKSADNTDDAQPQAPKPKHMFSGPMIFCKQKLDTKVDIFLHESLRYFEVKALDVEKKKPLPSLFIPLDKIVKINEKEFNGKYREVVAQRRDLVERAQLTSAIEYVMNSLSIMPSEEGPQLKISRYNAEERATEVLNEPKPEDLVETASNYWNNESKPQNNLFGSTCRDQRIKTATNMSDSIARDTKLSDEESARAVLYQKQAEKEMETVKSNSEHSITRSYGCEASVNPNKNSKAKWAWLWAFKKVVVFNRIERAMMDIFTKVIEERRAAEILQRNSPLSTAIKRLEKVRGRFRRKRVSSINYMKRPMLITDTPSDPHSGDHGTLRLKRSRNKNSPPRNPSTTLPAVKRRPHMMPPLRACRA